MVKLSIQDSEGRTTVVPLTDGELTIGRAEDNAICLLDRNVSRHHARLKTQGNRIVLENVAASWGTRLNKLLMREPTELQEGDTLQIGDYTLELASDDPRTRDTALVDNDGAHAQGQQRSANKSADGATAMINLADIQAGLTQTGPATAIPEQSQPRLVIESENLRGLELRVTRTPIVIGRVRENADLVVDHRSISKEHARLTRLSDGTWQILDLGSANGLKVNGEPYSKCDVTSGDRIELGHVTLRFLLAGAPAPALEDVGSPVRRKLPIALAVGLGVAIVAGLAVWALAPSSKSNNANAEEKSSSPPEAKAAHVEPEAAVVAPSVAADASVEEAPADAGLAAAQDSGELSKASVAQAVAKADDLRKSGLYAEALQILKAVEPGKSGNAQLMMKIKQVEADQNRKTKLDAAQAKLDTNPAGALDQASDVRAQLQADDPLLVDAEKIIAAAKASLAEKHKARLDAKADAKESANLKAESRKNEPREDVKAPAPEIKTPELKTPEVKAAKTGESLYKDGRDAQLAGKTDEAITLYSQATKAGYGKAYKALALIFQARNDKAGCARNAKAYLEKNPSAGDAEAMQQLLDKCTN